MNVNKIYSLDSDSLIQEKEFKITLTENLKD